MDPYGRKQSYIEYYFLDIIAISCVIFLLSSYIGYKILKTVLRCCCRSKKVKNE
ncbi:hypothetical protein CAEBREN_31467 [Caenorhabditis brenneri]|uniref:Uncharacterized protein n=1 Tax=Caenorhabditis brenneri TaxID=135651 RepID=G0PE87_CAEBE|nr:hypothetical protein CAEBREN_31467 [Caenorhabditis brenneri]